MSMPRTRRASKKASARAPLPGRRRADRLAPMTRPGLSLRLDDADLRVERDSVRRVNTQIRRALEARFDLAPEPDLVVAGALQVPEPDAPPHLFVPHGAVADPGHWLRHFSRLRSVSTPSGIRITP